MKALSRLLIVAAVTLVFATVTGHARQRPYLPPATGETAPADRVPALLRSQLNSVAQSLSLSRVLVALGDSVTDTIDLAFMTVSDGTIGRVTVAGENGMPVMAKFAVLMGGDIDTKSQLQAVIVEYVEFLGGGRHDLTNTYLRTFVFRDGRLVTQTPPLKVGRLDIVYTRVPGEKWRWQAADLTPAIITDSRILLTDDDSDGLQDLVVWTRVAKSRRLEDPDPGFALAEERLTVMHFDRSKQVFREPTPADRLPMPPAELWDRLPTIPSGRMR